MDSTLPKPAPSDPQPIVVELDPRTELQRMSITELIALADYCDRFQSIGQWGELSYKVSHEIAHRIDGVQDE